MDPASALDLATNVIQVLDFANRVALESEQLINASEDTLPSNDGVTRLVFEAQQLTQSIIDTAKAPVSSQNEESALFLTGRCNTATSDLLSILNDLQVIPNSDGSQSGSRALEQIVRTKIKRREIESSQFALQRVESQLAMAFGKFVREEQHPSFRQLERCLPTSNDDALCAILDTKVELLATARQQKQLLQTPEQSSQAAANSIHSEAKAVDETQRNSKGHADLRQEIHGGAKEVATDNIDLRQPALSSSDAQKARQITRSLEFSEILDRRDTIHPASHNTFRWVLEKPSPFRAWLESDRDFFWISGKFGSGKSTLMKYIAASSTTQDLLRGWAGNRAVHIIEVYFWYAGSKLQTSERGLMQTILYQILKNAPELVSLASPKRWGMQDSSDAEPDSWTTEEISEALMRILTASLDVCDTRFCILIDGLDEFPGDHLRLIRQCQELSRSSRIKLCVSSRPWDAFVDAFQNVYPMLRLEDHTKPDITRYVRSEMMGVLQENSEAEALVSEIIYKAQGVFLWVRLVVKSLLEGFVRGDDLTTLRQRVKAIPSDLEDYFSLMLSRVDKIYAKTTPQLLKLAMLFSEAASSNLHSSFLDFWLLRCEDPNPEQDDFAIKLAISEYDSTQLQRMLAETRKLVSACTKDLLYITHFTGAVGSDPYGYFGPAAVWPKIEFLHRTVYDFLNSQEQQQLLNRASPAHFQEEHFLCKVVLARLKVVPTGEDNLCSYCINHVAWAVDRPLLDDSIVAEFNRVASYYQHRFCTRHCRCLEQPKLKPGIVIESFTAFQLHSYVNRAVSERVHWSRGDRHGRHPPLKAALGFSPYRRFGLDEVDIVFVQLLLGAGADPNQVLDIDSTESETIWERFLTRWRALLILPGRMNMEHIWQVAKLLILYGAELDAGRPLSDGMGGTVRRPSLPVILMEKRLPESISDEVRAVIESVKNKGPTEARKISPEDLSHREREALIETRDLKLFGSGGWGRMKS